jgi:hypothetical protein
MIEVNLRAGFYVVGTFLKGNLHRVMMAKDLYCVSPSSSQPARCRRSATTSMPPFLLSLTTHGKRETQSAHLVCFPECYLPGYLVNTEHESTTGHATDRRRRSGNDCAEA